MNLECCIRDRDPNSAKVFLFKEYVHKNPQTLKNNFSYYEIMKNCTENEAWLFDGFYCEKENDEDFSKIVHRIIEMDPILNKKSESVEISEAMCYKIFVLDCLELIFEKLQFGKKVNNTLLNSVPDEEVYLLRPLIPFIFYSVLSRSVTTKLLDSIAFFGGTKTNILLYKVSKRFIIYEGSSQERFYVNTKILNLNKMLNLPAKTIIELDVNVSNITTINLIHEYVPKIANRRYCNVNLTGTKYWNSILLERSGSDITESSFNGIRENDIKYLGIQMHHPFCLRNRGGASIEKKTIYKAIYLIKMIETCSDKTKVLLSDDVVNNIMSNTTGLFTDIDKEYIALLSEVISKREIDDSTLNYILINNEHIEYLEEVVKETINFTVKKLSTENTPRPQNTSEEEKEIEIIRSDIPESKIGKTPLLSGNQQQMDSYQSALGESDSDKSMNLDEDKALGDMETAGDIIELTISQPEVVTSPGLNLTEISQLKELSLETSKSQKTFEGFDNQERVTAAKDENSERDPLEQPKTTPEGTKSVSSFSTNYITDENEIESSADEKTAEQNKDRFSYLTNTRRTKKASFSIDKNVMKLVNRIVCPDPNEVFDTYCTISQRPFLYKQTIEMGVKKYLDVSIKINIFDKNNLLTLFNPSVILKFIADYLSKAQIEIKELTIQDVEKEIIYPYVREWINYNGYSTETTATKKKDSLNLNPIITKIEELLEDKFRSFKEQKNNIENIKFICETIKTLLEGTPRLIEDIGQTNFQALTTSLEVEKKKEEIAIQQEILDNKQGLNDEEDQLKKLRAHLERFKVTN